MRFMKSLVLLFSLIFTLTAFSQQDLYYAMPVDQEVGLSNDLNYGQKVHVNLKDWANSNLDWIIVEDGQKDLEMRKNFLLPFSPPARNISMAEYAMYEGVLDFSFEAEVSGDWREHKTLVMPSDLSSGQMFTIMKSLFEKPLRSVDVLPTGSFNYSNYNLGEVYMVDVVKMDDYEHYVFYLNGSGEWLHNIQLIKDGQKDNKIIRTRYKVSSSPQEMDPMLFYVITDKTPFYSTSPINKSKAGTLKTNDELYLTPTQLVSASYGSNSTGEYHMKNGKKIRIAAHQVLSVPAPVNSRSLKEYTSMLHQLGLKTNYHSRQWIQDQKVYTSESFLMPTDNFASALLVLEKIYPTIKEHLSVMPNGIIIKKSDAVNLLMMESGEILQISVRNIGNNTSLGLLLDNSGAIKVVTQKI